MIALNKTIRLFLDSIGRRDEYEFYLKKFQSERSACFALLCPDLRSIEAGAEVLAFDLHFLLRLELVPAILLCGDDAEKMKAALAAEPIFQFHELGSGDTNAFIRQAKSDDKVPVLVAVGAGLQETLLQLVPGVAERVHFIRAAGGLKSADGELLPYIYTHKENIRPLENLERDYIELGGQLLQERPGTHVSITSPIKLLQEIFTVKGAGTLLRKGSKIHRFSGMEGVDRTQLIQLLESSFGKKLGSERFLDNVTEAYIEENHRGAVLLEEHPSGLYLSKFAVGREARGEGLALELWREVCENHPAFFWRSNVSNRFNSWYSQQADGYHISGKWQIFWRGVSTEAISGIIAYCCARGEDFAAEA
jgi:hypothetical protein